jgi:cell wall-associated NlpC family hydrolase
MRAALCLAGLFCASASLPSLAQTRLRFVDPPPDGRSVSGTLTLRVSSDPFRRPQGVRVGVSLDGDLLTTFDSLPADYAWDSAAVPNGEHYLRLVLVDPRSRTQTGIEELRLLISNKPKPPAAPAVPKTQEAPTQKPDKLDTPPVRETVEPRKEPSGPPSVSELRPQQDESVVSGPTFAASVERPLNVNATALYVSSENLYIGQSGGRITIYNVDRGTGSVVEPPAGAGDVRAITTGGGSVWWLTGTQSGGICKLFACKPGDDSVKTYDLTGVSDPKRIAYHRGRVYLFGTTGGAALDAKSGAVERLDTTLPGEGPGELSRAALYLAVDGSKATLAAVRLGRDGRSTVSLWQAHGERWTAAVSHSLAGSVWLSPGGVTAIAKSGVSDVKCGEDAGDPTVLPIPQIDDVSGPDCQAARSGNSAWWVRAGRVFHADLENRTADVFLPWNEKGLSARFAAADEQGVWVATNRGVRRIVLGKPESNTGYAGFIRMRLGSESDHPSSAIGQRMAEVIEEWQGVPYLWGGASQSGTDCSGFVMAVHEQLGLGLPHGSDSLRSCSSGQLVRDELRYGDVLVYPGHCALYIGDGRTAETVSRPVKGVGKSSVWRRTQVVVRRFIDVPSVPSVTPRAFASRHMKPGPLKKSKATPTPRRKDAKKR